MSRRGRRQTDIGTQPIPHETLAELAAAWRAKQTQPEQTQTTERK